MAEEKDRQGRVGQKLLAGTNFAVFTVVVIAIIVLANWFVDRNDKSWDLTPNQSFSLSPETLKLLKGLDQDVTIYVFDRKEALGKNRDVLSDYSSTSRRVKIQYVDADREPGLARQFGEAHPAAASQQRHDLAVDLLHVVTLAP